MTYSPTPPFAHSSGPHSAKIALVGEAWGKSEAVVKTPFVGASGQELTRILADAGISRKDCFLTNTFAFQPPDNKIENICGKKTEVGPNYTLQPIKQGSYILPEYLSELSRLKIELETVRPNIIIALGAIASWALLNFKNLSSIRGTTAESSLCPGIKVIPTYHPAGILRNWSWRVLAVADCMKALRESAYPEIRRPMREIWIDPSLDDIDSWISLHGNKSENFGVDIETVKGQIEMIGFAASTSCALVIPFIKNRSQNYWPTLEEELAARSRVQYLLSRKIPKTFQNGLYDLQYIYREKFSPCYLEHDTMLLHHSLFPEMQKGLGFLGSLYTDESSWKLLNRRRGGEELKRDE